MFTEDTIATGAWTVQRVSMFRISPEMRRALARIAVSKALLQQRRAVEGLEPPMPYFRKQGEGSADSNIPRFTPIVSRALEQAAEESRTVVRASVVRSSLDARFREFGKSVDRQVQNPVALADESKKWMARARGHFGPYGAQRAHQILLATAASRLSNAEALNSDLETRSAEAGRQLNAQIQASDESLAAYESSIRSAPVAAPAGIITGRNFIRLSPYVMWALVSTLLVLLLLPGSSWLVQTAAGAVLFIFICALQWLLKRNQTKERSQNSEYSLIREAQSSIRRLSPQFKLYYEVAERRLLAAAERNVASQLVQALETASTQYRTLATGLQALEQAVLKSVQEIPAGSFVEITPTRWELIGYRPAETILHKRIGDLNTAEFGLRVLRKYELKHGTSFADAILDNDACVIREQLEEVVLGEIGDVSMRDLIGALIESDGGEALLLHTRILAGGARNAYRFGSILSRDQHSGHYTVGLPAGTGPEIRAFFEKAFTRPPAIQTSFGDDIEVWWTALNLTNEDSMLHQRGMEFARQFDDKTRELLWQFPDPSAAAAAPSAHVVAGFSPR